MNTVGLILLGVGVAASVGAGAVLWGPARSDDDVRPWLPFLTSATLGMLAAGALTLQQGFPTAADFMMYWASFFTGLAAAWLFAAFLLAVGAIFVILQLAFEN